MNQSHRFSFLACIMLAASLVGCGGGSSGSSLQPANDSGTIGGTTQPSTGASIALLQSIENVNRDINGEQFYWACNASRRNNVIGYIVGSSDDYSFTIGTWLSNVNVDDDTFSGSEDFRVTSGSENSLTLSYADIGAIEEISNIIFVSDSSWTAFSTTEGTIECFADVIPGSIASRSLSPTMILSEIARLSQESDDSLVKRSDGSSGKLTN